MVKIPIALSLAGFSLSRFLLILVFFLRAESFCRGFFLGPGLWPSRMEALTSRVRTLKRPSVGSLSLAPLGCMYL